MHILKMYWSHGRKSYSEKHCNSIITTCTYNDLYVMLCIGWRVHIIQSFIRTSGLSLKPPVYFHQAHPVHSSRKQRQKEPGFSRGSLVVILCRYGHECNMMIIGALGSIKSQCLSVFEHTWKKAQNYITLLVRTSLAKCSYKCSFQKRNFLCIRKYKEQLFYVCYWLIRCL